MKTNPYCSKFDPKWFLLILWIYCFSIQGMGPSHENAKHKEVSESDYTVYTSFFATEKLPSIEIPQFFEDAVKTKKVFENTVVAKPIKPEELSELSGTFVNEFSSIVTDYLKNNTTEFIVREKILIPDLTILTKAEREKRLSGKLTEVPTQLTGEYVSLSRPGFNKEGDKALFYIVWNGSAVAGYYVLMQKQDHKWIIKNVKMDNMIIF